MNAYQTQRQSQTTYYSLNTHTLSFVSLLMYVMAFFLVFRGYEGAAWALAFMGSISFGYAFSEKMLEADDTDAVSYEEEQELVEDESIESEDGIDIDALFDEYVRKRRDEETIEQIENYSFSKVRICPECGTEFDASRKRCPSCGCDLEEPEEKWSSLLVPGTRTFMLSVERGRAVMMDDMGEELESVSIGGETL